MIIYMQENIFDTPAKAYVNTVNTQGVMGKGIAKVFKSRYPGMFREYQDLCEKGEIGIGRLWFYTIDGKVIVNFPTKEQWRKPSRPEYIEEGLKDFCDRYTHYGISSIAFPPLGCGNGGLDFENQVKPIMERYLENLPIPVLIYPHKRSAERPEHLDMEPMTKWLKTEPTSLPFSEVWADILHSVLGEPGIDIEGIKHRIDIIENEKNEDKGIRIRNGEVFTIYYDDLRLIWNLLRESGFVLERDLFLKDDKVSRAVLMIFRKIEYIRPFRGLVSGDSEPSYGIGIDRLHMVPQYTLMNFT